MTREKRGVPGGLWLRCEDCGETIFRKEAEGLMSVCPQCGYHMYLSAPLRVKWVLDEGTFEEWDADLSPMDHVRGLRDGFWRQLQGAFGNGVALNGHPVCRLPNTLNVSFIHRIGAEILEALDGVAASTGSACHAGEVTLSPVLRARGVQADAGLGAVRFSLGRATTADEIDAVVTDLSRKFPKAA